MSHIKKQTMFRGSDSPSRDFTVKFRLFCLHMWEIRSLCDTPVHLIVQILTLNTGTILNSSQGKMTSCKCKNSSLNEY